MTAYQINAGLILAVAIARIIFVCISLEKNWTNWRQAMDTKGYFLKNKIRVTI